MTRHPRTVVTPEMVNECLERAKENPKWNEFNEQQKRFINPNTAHRYVFAFKGKIPLAVDKIFETMTWRRDTKLDERTWEDVAHSAQTGSKYLRGYGKHGHAVIVQRPRVEAALDQINGTSLQETIQGQLRLTEYLIDCALCDMQLKGKGQDKIIFLFDFKDWSMKRQASGKARKDAFYVTQNYFPECTEKIVLIDVPSWAILVFKALRPFLDPVTTEKIVLVNGKNKRAVLSELIDTSEIEQEFGGDYEGKYNHESEAKKLREIDRLRKRGDVYPWAGAQHDEFDEEQEAAPGVQRSCLPCVGN